MRMAAPTLLGNLQEYHPDSETFSAYLERVTLFFTTNAIPDDNKVAVFLTVIGSQLYSLVRSLVAPTLPQDNSLEDLVDVLKRHFEPKPLVIAERFHFHKRAKAVGESIAEYMAELRLLTTHCNNKDHLEEALHDRLVCGIRDVDTQRKLLSVPDLTLKKALEIAQGSEAAVNMAKSLKVVDTSINTGVPLTKSSTLLRTYSGEPLSVLGVINVEVQYKQQRESLKLTIVSGKGPSLLGRDWLQHFKLDWGEIKALASHTEGSLDYLIEKYNTLFTEGLGTIKTFQARLQVDPEGPPKFFKPRTAPYAIREAVEDEFNRLEHEGILEKVTHSEWATPVVVVPKADGSVRLCGDFKVTINPLLKVDQYPLPKAEDLFATLAGGQQFTKLDLSQAYLQLQLHPDSMQYCTINTSRGLYQYTCLPFGVASVPALFQRVMDTILQGVPGAICYIDDIPNGGGAHPELVRGPEAFAAVWSPNEAKQVPLHAGVCRIFGAHCGFYRDKGHPRESGCLCTGTSTPECGSAQVLLGFIELLPEVLTKPCQSGTAIECVAPEGQEMGIVN